jgi:hypothetical protein
MKTRKTAAGFIFLMALLMLTGCYKSWHHVEGNFDVQTETRNFSSFEKVFNEGEFDVYIIQDGSGEVEIEAESNLIPLIRTRMEGSALVIDTKDDLDNNYPMKVFVHTEEINEIRLSGSGLVEAENLETNDLEIDLSGSGDMLISSNSNDIDCRISGSGDIDLGLVCNFLELDINGSGDLEVYGTAQEGDFNISGSGTIRAYDLTLQECTAKISGSGSMYVTVEDYLNVNISGSGNIYYMGDPQIDAKITGSGEIIHP